MAAKKKPLVVITRKLPDPVETRMRELFDARLNVDDRPLDAGRADAGDAGSRRAGPDDHRPYRRGADRRGRRQSEADRQFRKRRRQDRRVGGGAPGHDGDEHAERPHRGHRRHDDGADADCAAAADRGRQHPRIALQMDRLVADLDARQAHLGQAPGHCGDGPHRHGGRAPRQGVRPVHSLPQPAPRAAGSRGRARGDLLGEPRPDACPDGHHFRELPLHAGDLPSALGTPPRLDASLRPTS